MRYLILLLLLSGCGPSEKPLRKMVSQNAKIKADKLCQEHGGVIFVNGYASGYGSEPHYEAQCKYNEVHFRVKE